MSQDDADLLNELERSPEPPKWPKDNLCRIVGIFGIASLLCYLLFR